MQFTSAKIRDTSFGLAAQGYNPDQVDAALYEIAEQLDNGAAVDPALLNANFDTVVAGYDAREVAAFLGSISATMPTETASTDPQAPELDEEPTVHEEPHAHPEVPADLDLGAGASSADESNAPADIDLEPKTVSPIVAPRHQSADAVRSFAPAPEMGAQESTFGVRLPQAIERTKLAVTELEGFIADQLVNTKAALRGQIAETQKDCTTTLVTARQVSNKALETARYRAQVILQEANRSTDDLRETFHARLEELRGTFEKELARRHEEIRTDLELLVEEAKAVTGELEADISSIEDHVRTSLEDARGVLTENTGRLAA
jgi:DivIVA domain-containing protein